MSDEFASLRVYGGSPEKRDKERQRFRKMYADDPEYRQRKIDAAKARYHAKKKKKSSQSSRRRGRLKARSWVMPDGQIITIIGAGEAADIIGVSKRTFINYEKKGVIPLNRLVDEHGRRWYPKSFIEWLSRLLAGQAQAREPLWRLRRRVERAWQEDHQHIPALEEQDHAREDRGQEGHEG